MKQPMILAYLLCVAAPLGAQVATVAALPYEVPPGWTHSLDPASGLTSLTPPGLRPPRICVITVFTPEAFTGSGAEYHGEMLRRATSTARQLEAPQQGSVGAFLVTTLHQVMPNGLQLWIRIYTGRWGDRGQTFIFTANMPDVAQQFAPVADTMMSRIALPQPPRLTQQPSAPTGGGLNGLYLTLKVKGGFNSGASKDYMVFFPNGRVFWHLPDEGLLDFDAARSQQEDANFWGSYELRGDAFHIHWASGLEYDGQRAANGTLAIAGYTYVPQTSGADGRTLSGTYRPSTVGADPSKDVTFYPDGRFEDRGVRVVVGALDLAYGRSKVPTEPGSGRYRIARNSIVFEYTDGRHEQLSFYVPDDDGGPTPPLIVIHTYSVLRVPR